MKKIILIIAFTFTFNLAFGQNFTQLVKYEFESSESYKTEENKVLLCANYLFNNPANQEKLNRKVSIAYIMKWMMGTPNYSFDIGEKSMKLTKGSSDLFSLYMAAMSKVVLENKGEKLKNDEIYNQAENILVNYCSNKSNKMRPSKKIKKIIKKRKG